MVPGTEGLKWWFKHDKGGYNLSTKGKKMEKLEDTLFLKGWYTYLTIGEKNGKNTHTIGVLIGFQRQEWWLDLIMKDCDLTIKYGDSTIENWTYITSKNDQTL